MGRSYSAKFIAELQANTSDGLGVQLAKLCTTAGIPAVYVAAAVRTSRVTVYGWFRGQGVRERNRHVVEALISLLRKDFEDGILPVESSIDAKRYIEQLAGIKID